MYKSKAPKIRTPKHPSLVTLAIFILPYFILLFIFKVFPIFINFFYSFFEMDLLGNKSFAKFANYKSLFRDRLFWKATANTFQYLLYVGPVNVVFGFLLAMLLNQRLRGTVFARTVIFMPYVIMITLVGITWRWILDGQNGLLNHYLRMFGIKPVYWLTTEATAMIGIAITSIWWTIGYNMIIYLAALQEIPKDLVEAANIDGANPFQKLIYITIPMVKNTTFFCILTTIIYSMQMFGQVYVMTAGGPNYSTLSLVQYLYIKGFREFSLGYSAAIGSLLFIIILVMSLVIFKIFSEKKESSRRVKG